MSYSLKKGINEMIKDDCIFCKLANGVFPTNKIYEDDDFTVILDASPANKGHALILPKQHADNLFELSDETAAKVMPLAKKIAAALSLSENTVKSYCIRKKLKSGNSQHVCFQCHKAIEQPLGNTKKKDFV